MYKTLAKERFDKQLLDLNQMFDEDWKPPLKMMNAGPEWAKAFEEQCLVQSDEEAEKDDDKP
jgi:hypothetical protein